MIESVTIKTDRPCYCGDSHMRLQHDARTLRISCTHCGIQVVIDATHVYWAVILQNRDGSVTKTAAPTVGSPATGRFLHTVEFLVTPICACTGQAMSVGFESSEGASMSCNQCRSKLIVPQITKRIVIDSVENSLIEVLTEHRVTPSSCEDCSEARAIVAKHKLLP